MRPFRKSNESMRTTQIDPILQVQDSINRRTFLAGACGFGLSALGVLLNQDAAAASTPPGYVPKAKRVIYLFQSGAPSQMELFDHKPRLADLMGQNLPDSIRNGQRLTGLTSGQKTFPVA